MKNETYKHIRINETTGKEDYYFPMEITSSDARVWAREQGYEIGRTRLGFRVFEAAMIPCKNVSRNEHGREVFVETPSEEQKFRYLEYIKDEMNEQEDIKQDGRCVIPDGHGGTKRCPLRVPNPDYTPDNGQPKTLPVKCDGCRNEPVKYEHTFVSASALDHTDSHGNVTPYEPPIPFMHGEGDRYLRLRKGFVNYVREREPELATLAYLLTEEYSKRKIAKGTETPRTTLVSRTKKLIRLYGEYVENACIY